MISTITYKGIPYPALQAQGFAAQWAFPFALNMCSGNGVDIGCNREEWCLPGAEPVEPLINKFDAYAFPDCDLDFVFSSHCIEHLRDWVEALDYWHTKLLKGGVLFLYLPNMDAQQYWQPQNNRKHLHYLNPHILRSYFIDRPEMWNNVFVTDGFDLNCSFYAVAEKR